MVTKILKIHATIFLIMIPFLVGMSISKYTPYIEDNNFKTYVWISGITSLVATGVSLFFIKYLFQVIDRLFSTEVLLFLMLFFIGVALLSMDIDKKYNHV